LQNHLHVPKITKKDAFSSFSIIHAISRHKESENGAAAISKVQAAKFQNKKGDGRTDKKNKLTVCKNLKIQKFNFNAHAHHELISGASHREECTYVDSDAVRLYLGR
jgi:hypothetical protein